MHRIRGGATDRKRLIALTIGILPAIALIVFMSEDLGFTIAAVIGVVLAAGTAATVRLGVDIDPRRGELRRWWGPGFPLWKVKAIRHDHFDELRVTKAVYRSNDGSTVYYYVRMHQDDVPLDGTFLYRSSNLQTSADFASSVAEATGLRLTIAVDETE